MTSNSSSSVDCVLENNFSETMTIWTSSFSNVFHTLSSNFQRHIRSLKFELNAVCITGLKFQNSISPEPQLACSNGYDKDLSKRLIVSLDNDANLFQIRAQYSHRQNSLQE